MNKAFETKMNRSKFCEICNLHHSSQQHQILNPLSKATDQTCILMDTSQVLNLLSHNGNSPTCFLYLPQYLLFPPRCG